MVSGTEAYVNSYRYYYVINALRSILNRKENATALIRKESIKVLLTIISNKMTTNGKLYYFVVIFENYYKKRHVKLPVRYHSPDRYCLIS